MVYKNSLRFSQNLIFPHFFCVIEQNSVWVVISSFFFFPVRIIMYQKFYYYFLIKWQNENLLILTLTSLGFCMCLEYFDFFFPLMEEKKPIFVLLSGSPKLQLHENIL